MTWLMVDMPYCEAFVWLVSADAWELHVHSRTVSTYLNPHLAINPFTEVV